MCQQSPSLPSKTRNVHSNNYICQRVVVINIYADCSLDRKWQKMTQHFFASVSAQRGWGTMCVSVIHFTASQLSYSCEEEDRPHLIQTGRLWELGGGREHTGFFFFFYTRTSHVLPAPCAAVASLSSSVVGDMLSAESTPSAHTAKYDAREVSDSFINDELNKQSKSWGKVNKQRHQQQIRVDLVLTLGCYRC